MTTEDDLKRLIVNVTPNQRNRSELVKEIVAEIKRARDKCYSITEINNIPASVIELRLKGQDGVCSIGITYISQGKENTKEFSKEEFYKLGN